MWLKQIQFRFYGLLCCPVVGSMLYGLIHVSSGTLLGGALWLGFPMSVWVETAAAQLVMPPLCFVSKTRETELRLIGDYLNMGCLFQCWVFFFFTGILLAGQFFGGQPRLYCRDFVAHLLFASLYMKNGLYISLDLLTGKMY